MAVFLNWFALEFSRPIQELPRRIFASWDDLKTFVEAQQWKRSGYVASALREDAEARVQLIPIDQSYLAAKQWEASSFELSENMELGSRIAELSLQRHFLDHGFNVHSGQYESTATQEDFQIESVGVRVEKGVSFKPYFLQYRRRYGITLDWSVRAFCEKPIAAIQTGATDIFAGMPVVLAKVPQSVDNELLRYAGKYLGIVTSFNGVEAKVRCRDYRERVILGSEIFPEARPDVLNLLDQWSSGEHKNSSLQKRMMILSFSLTPAGRKNVRILQDRLKAAIETINPDARTALIIDLQRPLAGRMRIEMAPANAQFAT
jgi:hypothetical protein